MCIAICCILKLFILSSSSWKCLIFAKAVSLIGTCLADLTCTFISIDLGSVYAWRVKTVWGPNFLFWVNKFFRKTTIGDSICSKMYSFTIYSVILYLALEVFLLLLNLSVWILNNKSLISFMISSSCFLKIPSLGL